MEAIRLPTTVEHQANRMHIAKILRSEDLLASIKVNIDGRLRAIPIAWNEYWAPVRQSLASDLTKSPAGK